MADISVISRLFWVFIVILVCMGSIYTIIESKKRSVIKKHLYYWNRQETIYNSQTPNEYPIFGFYLNNEESRPEIVRLISLAKHELIFCSYCTDYFCDFYQGHSLHFYLKRAHHRGVHIILCVNPWQYRYLGKDLSDLKRYRHMYTIIESKKQCRIQGIEYCHHHIKAICIDRSLLFIGGGVDTSSESWKEFDTCNRDDIDCWTDSSVLTRCSDEVMRYILSSSVDGDYKNTDNFEISGLAEHNNFIYLIRSARHYIYLENQFFDSSDITENRILVELSKAITRSIQQNTEFYVMILTNNFYTNTDEAYMARIYVHYTTIRIQSDVLRICRDTDPTITREQVDRKLFVGILKRDPYYIQLHTQVMIQDGMRMIKTSSNITDRSLSHSPCDKELGLIFNDPEKIYMIQQKLWNHRLETNNRHYTIRDVFLAANNESGHYRHVIKTRYDHLGIRLINSAYYFMESTGPCHKGYFRNQLV
jgi:phosphatidylserine/phosphatidylglycerophosphate/cardiolipin synthase-like enzyme